MDRARNLFDYNLLTIGGLCYVCGNSLGLAYRLVQIGAFSSCNIFCGVA